MAIKVCQVNMSQRQRLLISVQEKVAGKPYRGKPDVRFDEGEWKRADVRFDERAKGMRPTGNPPLATVNTHLIPSQHQCSTLLLPDAPRPATIAAYYHPRRFGLKDKRIHFKKYNKKIL